MRRKASFAPSLEDRVSPDIHLRGDGEAQPLLQVRGQFPSAPPRIGPVRETDTGDANAHAGQVFREHAVSLYKAAYERDEKILEPRGVGGHRAGLSLDGQDLGVQVGQRDSGCPILYVYSDSQWAGTTEAKDSWRLAPATGGDLLTNRLHQAIADQTIQHLYHRGPTQPCPVDQLAFGQRLPLVEEREDASLAGG